MPVVRSDPLAHHGDSPRAGGPGTSRHGWPGTGAGYPGRGPVYLLVPALIRAPSRDIPPGKAVAIGPEVAIAAPGRMNDLLEMGCIDLSKVQFLVLDEADRM